MISSSEWGGAQQSVHMQVNHTQIVQLKHMLRNSHRVATVQFHASCFPHVKKVQAFVSIWHELCCSGIHYIHLLNPLTLNPISARWVVYDPQSYTNLDIMYPDGKSYIIYVFRLFISLPKMCFTVKNVKIMHFVVLATRHA